MNTLELAKRLKYKEGDQVRGITELYPRSIYRVVAINEQGVHLVWESLSGIKAEDISSCPAPKRLLRWETPIPKTAWDEFEGALDFRIATPLEIKRSKEVRE
jgi:hypothetical protein